MSLRFLTITVAALFTIGSTFFLMPVEARQTKTSPLKVKRASIAPIHPKKRKSTRSHRKQSEHSKTVIHLVSIGVVDVSKVNRVGDVLNSHGIYPMIDGSVVYDILVDPKDRSRARALVLKDSKKLGYFFEPYK